ncbi:MAG: zinc-binding dehydrogenase [Sphingobacteriia bacterium]|nr:zinc-binding dehydrogenase [Sphingobacteriia bacterium]
MIKKYRLNSCGGPEKLELVQDQTTIPNSDEVLVAHNFIGINHQDVLRRKGIIPTKTPYVLGYEAVGKIEKIGNGVEWKDLNEGDKVIYATVGSGAYSTHRVINPYFLVKLPSDIDQQTAIACFSKTLTAHYLLKRVAKIKEGQPILIHGAAGSVGHILCQVAKFYNLKVFATVNSKEKYDYLTSLKSCEMVIDVTQQDFVSEIMKKTKNIGVDIVYDLVGGDYLTKSFKCMNFLAVAVSLGDIAGRPNNLDLTLLDDRCLFVTRPDLNIYQISKMELTLAANDAFELMRRKAIKPTINIYNFDEISKAHSDIESGTKIGSYIAKI